MTNKLNQLLDELCPEGVEFKKIWELATIGTGKSNWNEAIEDGLFPFFVRSKIVKSLNSFEFDEEAIIIPGEWWIGDIFHYVSWKYALHQRAYRISFFDKWVNTKFVYYYMFANFKAFILKYAVNATVSSIRKPMIQNFQIPIPPLPVQEEIVKILDKFTSLEAELEAELEARKSQYEYYRDKLLAFGEGKVEWKSLGEVWELIRWNGLQKKDFTESGFPCIHYGQIYTHYGTFATKTKSFVSEELAKKLKHARYGDVLIAWTSENLEDVNKAVGWIGEEEIAISWDMFAFRPNKELNTKYLTYIFQTESYFKHKQKYARWTKVIRVSWDDIKNFKIPIPPLEQQEAIVYVLDNFDKLANDLTGWLPAELKLRQQQYEYYRDLLLDFVDKNGDLRERERERERES